MIIADLFICFFLLGTDYCTAIEGDECCSCWDAYFELNKLEVQYAVRANLVNRYLKPRVSLGLIQLYLHSKSCPKTKSQGW
jgi:hypothetical protein